MCMDVTTGASTKRKLHQGEEMHNSFQTKKVPHTRDASCCYVPVSLCCVSRPKPKKKKPTALRSAIGSNSEAVEVVCVSLGRGRRHLSPPRVFRGLPAAKRPRRYSPRPAPAPAVCAVTSTCPASAPLHPLYPTCHPSNLVCHWTGAAAPLVSRALCGSRHVSLPQGEESLSISTRSLVQSQNCMDQIVARGSAVSDLPATGSAGQAHAAPDAGTHCVRELHGCPSFSSAATPSSSSSSESEDDDGFISAAPMDVVTDSRNGCRFAFSDDDPDEPCNCWCHVIYQPCTRCDQDPESTEEEAQEEEDAD
jgi:hypothetical protein